MTRYFTAFGSNPEACAATWTMSGPQVAAEIPEGVKLLLAMPGVTQVDVRFNLGQGDRINTFQNMTKIELDPVATNPSQGSPKERS